MTTRRTRREQLLSEHSVRRSPRLSQRFSQPPETTSSHPLVESRRSLRSTVSVEPLNILDESGQTVPPSFYGDELEQYTRKVTAGEHLRSYISQRGLPEHLYGLDNSDSSDGESYHAETQRQSTPLSQPDRSTTLRTPGVHHPHAIGVCPRIVGFFTSVMFKLGSLLYLAATTILCLDVVLLHRLFHSGVSTRSLARYWILPLIMLALMLLMLRGGMPDSDWNAPPTDLPHISDAELHKFRAAIFREVAATLEKEIGSFRSILKTEMEAHVSKHVREVLLDTETKFEATIHTAVDEEAKSTQKSLSLLRESIWKELNSSLESYVGRLQTFVNNQIGTFTGQIDTEKLDWITQDTLAMATNSLRQELKAIIQNSADDLRQQMETIESDVQRGASSVNDNLLGIQRKQEISTNSLSLLTKRVDVHDEQIAALEQKYHDILFEIASFKNSYLMRLQELERARNESVVPSTVMKIFNEELDKVLSDDRSPMRLWLEQRFVSKEDFLKTLLQRSAGSSGGNVTEEEIQQMIDLSLARYSADRIGKFDFALENSGGSVILDMCSNTYSPSLATVSLFGYPVWHVTTTPKVIIQPQVYPGDCWAFEGSSGYATIKLKDTVQITGITIDHIPKVLSPNGSLDSAPKDIKLVGLNSLDDEGEELGLVEYKLDGDAIQQFEIEPQNPKAFQFVQFRFMSNYGHPKYTCVYRVRVHGQYI